MIAGDLGQRGDDYLKTDPTYDRCISAAGFDKKIYCVKGNHDVYIPLDAWKSVTSCDLSTYSFTKEDDLFIFMSMKTNTSSAKCSPEIDTAPYNDSDIDTLEQILRSNPGKRVFLTMHCPLNAGRPIS